MRKKNIPIINFHKDRENSILNNTPAIFQIERDPKNIKWGVLEEIRTNDKYGKDAVQKHDRQILKYSEKYNVDPDLVRSVMYAENARGNFAFLNEFADITHVSDSIFPMNIQKIDGQKL